jgi:hypothetical protein
MKDAFLTFFTIISAMLIAWSLSGCGLDLTVDPLEVKPVQVVHSAGLNYELLEQYFEEQCQDRYGFDPATVSECVEEKTGEFSRALLAAMGGGE